MAKLNIITPFKGDIQDLISTINSLINSYDSHNCRMSSYLIRHFDSVTRALYSFSHNQITFKLLVQLSRIYEAINQFGHTSCRRLVYCARW